jgi:tetratricopeptide (TPR) repeat protein
MKNILIVVFALVLPQACFSQSYIEVFRNGILGQMYNEQGRADSAEKYLRKALELMPDKTNFPCYFSLIKIAFSKNDTKKFVEYLRDLSCIYTADTVFIYLKEYSEISMDATSFTRLYHPRCNLTKNKSLTTPHPGAVDSIIVSMRERDQAIRRKVNNQKASSTEAELVALEKEFHEVDSVNFIILYDCIKKYGMRRLGGEEHLGWSRSTLITHVDNYHHFKKIESYLLKAVNEGVYSPAEYAYAMDRSLVASGMRPRYYWFIKGTDYAEKYKPDERQKAIVNKHRRLIGLPDYPLWTGWGF